MANDNADESKQVIQTGIIFNRGENPIPNNRALGAISKLVGAFIDIGVARLERPAEKIRAETKRQILKADIEASKEIEAIKLELLSLEERAIANEKARIVHRQENLEYIASIAVEDLRATNQEEEIDQETEKVSEDWVNYFGDIAGKMSSRHMKDLFGRILADEIKNPGQIHISTMMMLANLNKSEAELIEKYSSKVINGGIVDTITDDITNYKPDFLLLEDVGFVLDARNATAKQFRCVESDGQLITIIPIDKKHCLLVNTGLTATYIKSLEPMERLKFMQRKRYVLRNDEKDVFLIIPNIILTREGVELSEILSKPSANAVAEIILDVIGEDIESHSVLNTEEFNQKYGVLFEE